MSVKVLKLPVLNKSQFTLLKHIKLKTEDFAFVTKNETIKKTLLKNCSKSLPIIGGKIKEASERYITFKFLNPFKKTNLFEKVKNILLAIVFIIVMLKILGIPLIKSNEILSNEIPDSKICIFDNEQALIDKAIQHIKDGNYHLVDWSLLIREEFFWKILRKLKELGLLFKIIFDLIILFLPYFVIVYYSIKIIKNFLLLLWLLFSEMIKLFVERIEKFERFQNNDCILVYDIKKLFELKKSVLKNIEPLEFDVKKILMKEIIQKGAFIPVKTMVRAIAEEIYDEKKLEVWYNAMLEGERKPRFIDTLIALAFRSLWR